MDLNFEQFSSNFKIYPQNPGNKDDIMKLLTKRPIVVECDDFLVSSCDNFLVKSEMTILSKLKDTSL